MLEDRMNDDLDPRKNFEGRNTRVLSREVFYRGQTIITQGDQGGVRAYYIERGRVGVYVRDDKHELKVAEMGPGDIFGEMALITHEARSATVRAIDDCTLTVISRDEIEGKIRRIEDTAIRALINVLAERLRNATKGQLSQYTDFADFQDMVTGIVDSAQDGVSDAHRAAFREEVTPLLDKLQGILDKYQAKDAGKRLPPK